MHKPLANAFTCTVEVAYNDDQGTANSRRYKRTSLHKTIFFL
jgi:hypothetical protein